MRIFCGFASHHQDRRESSQNTSYFMLRRAACTLARCARQSIRPLPTMAPSRSLQTAISSLNITFLGTASAQPSSTRNHSALALRLNGDVWLFDCGEATQSQIQKSQVKMGKIKKIFITHTHGLCSPDTFRFLFHLCYAKVIIFLG